MILLAVAVIGLASVFVLVDLVSVQAQNQDEAVSEFRSDGIEVITYQDGSKLFKATMEDGISSSDDLR